MMYLQCQDMCRIYLFTNFFVKEKDALEQAWANYGPLRFLIRPAKMILNLSKSENSCISFQ